MENIIFNELKVRGYNVDVGVVVMNETDQTGKKIRKQLEIDFVCNKGSKRYYIQSAFAMQDEKKMQQEERPLINTGDGFKKIIITKDALAPLYNEEGVLVMSVFDFLGGADEILDQMRSLTGGGHAHVFLRRTIEGRSALYPV